MMVHYLTNRLITFQYALIFETIGDCSNDVINVIFHL